MDPATTCALCPKLCRFACPVDRGCGDENATPTAMGTLVHLRRLGELRYEPENTHPLYRCTSCGACAVPCEIEIDVPGFVVPERERVWNAGAAPPEVRRVADHVAGGRPPDDRSGHHADLDGPRLGDGERGNVYWPGCALAGADRAAVAHTRELLERVLEEPVTLPPVTAPACCGDPLRAAGDRSRYMGHRSSLSHALRPASRVITSCACCLESLPLGAEHVTAVLGITWPRQRRHPAVAFHDPCRLTRPEDRSGAPRALLASATGSEVEEFVDRGRETGCCGAGDAFGSFFPRDGDAVAAQRLRDPAVERAKMVVTSCSRCTAQLQHAAEDGVRVRDLGDFLHRLERGGRRRRKVSRTRRRTAGR